MLALCGTMTTQAQLTESPWTEVASEPASGTFYLYNVESGMWLQNNRRAQDYWTTYVQIGPHGLDFVLTKDEEGRFQLDPRFGRNHSVNGGDQDFGYMDTSRDVTYWDVVKKGIGYEISSNAGSHFLNVSKGMIENVVDGDWVIDDLGDDGIWQFVSKEARMADLAKATKAEPRDATWLINGWDFANMDERNASWVNEITGSGSGVAFNQGWRPARAAEIWSSGHGEYHQTITGLPNGTYGLTVQGFYRDGSTGGVLDKHLNGEEEIRGWFFANGVSQPLMSICESGATEEIADVFSATSGFYGPGDGSSALGRAANAFFLGYYQNPELKVVVSDGTLRIGIRKESDLFDDWLVFDNFELTYYGSGVDIDELQANLNKAIEEAEAYEGNVLPVLAAAKSAAEEAKSSTDATVISQATSTLQDALRAVKAMNKALADADAVQSAEWIPPFFTAALSEGQTAAQDTDPANVITAAQTLSTATDDAFDAIDIHTFYFATKPLALADGVAQNVIDTTQPIVEAGNSRDEMSDALETLRTARKIMKAEKHPDVFNGNVPEDQMNYYLYNVGLKRFLCGGGNWGAHAYVGFPGVEVSIYADTHEPGEEEEGEAYSGFVIDTHLKLGEELHYLNYGGYMDTGVQDLWEFVPVEGKTGVYNIARANGEKNEAGQRMLLGYRDNTYGNIDTDVYGESNPNNQWKLVTVADRDDLLATATNDAPQDASYKILCPNFDQRDDDSPWVRDNGTIYGRNGNYSDFAYECWNANPFSLAQYVFDLEPGWYVLSCSGYYREGGHENQIYVIGSGGEPMQAAMLYADMEDVPLMNITSEADKAPGLGDRRRVSAELDEDGDAVSAADGEYYVGEFPYWCSQACEYFALGLYKNQVLIEVVSNGELEIGVTKDHEQLHDWVVVDNFRLTYFGTQKPSPDAIESVRDDMATTTNATERIYNLQGVEMQGTLSRGLYIKNGKKVVVK